MNFSLILCRVKLCEHERQQWCGQRMMCSVLSNNNWETCTNKCQKVWPTRYLRKPPIHNGFFSFCFFFFFLGWKGFLFDNKKTNTSLARLWPNHALNLEACILHPNAHSENKTMCSLIEPFIFFFFFFENSYFFSLHLFHRRRNFNW